MEGHHWFCFDWKTTDFDIYGTWRTDEYFSALEIRMLPCATQVTAFDGSLLGGDQSCIYDKEEVLEYLGSAIDLLVLANHGDFNQNDFEDDRIKRAAKITTLGS